MLGSQLVVVFSPARDIFAAGARPATSARPHLLCHQRCAARLRSIVSKANDSNLSAGVLDNCIVSPLWNGVWNVPSLDNATILKLPSRLLHLAFNAIICSVEDISLLAILSRQWPSLIKCLSKTLRRKSHVHGRGQLE